LCQVLAKRKSW